MKHGGQLSGGAGLREGGSWMVIVSKFFPHDPLKGKTEHYSQGMNSSWSGKGWTRYPAVLRFRDYPVHIVTM